MLLGGREHTGKEAHTKPETMPSFSGREPKYPVGVVLTLSKEGVSALGMLGIRVQVLGMLGIGVQVLGSAQARGWGDPSNSILYIPVYLYLKQ